MKILQEYVSKKRKLQAEKRKRDKLVQEVRYESFEDSIFCCCYLLYFIE